jgi:hypothetical protein
MDHGQCDRGHPVAAVGYKGLMETAAQKAVIDREK